MHAKRRKNILKQTKGYQWGRKSHIKEASTAILHAGVHARRDRHRKKADFRALWTIRLNAFLRERGLTYSKFIPMLKRASIDLDRKTMSSLIMNHPEVMAKIVESVK
ncbi:MAG: large subunit ribosomal protein L20 [Parcubacteria group bacterium Gr01-1014_18]|nr:MAG: large subunit ribosomal protein L20 [Parcubacteria group bacterium Greene0416_36]TSC79877.1 MAG: large subunit ribosomal protein L20 [Parcubacteria group bacterium Gr01-1014_18]TSC98309.1 MAG: large subunit ribosomal protein L20 [Parcubacteria group bacterium Greene1014_20]TSD06650.1 MAG: large subunit ribosomal protein L20 [Parcubacteria group bacterium Greene0714_2]